MDCERCRAAISARVDGEETGVPSGVVEAHLVGCAACRRFEDRATVLNRRVRVGAAASIPDRTEQLVNAMVGVGPRWRLDLVRALLVGLAAVEVVTGALTLLGLAQGGATIHETRELGGFGVAFGIGLFLAAVRPVRIAGVFPVVLTVAVTSMLGAAVDVAAGRTLLVGELHHLIEVAAVLVLWRLTRPVRLPPFGGRLVASL